MNQWLAMLLVAGAFGGLLITGIRLRRSGWHPELTRKLLHVGMGVVTLSFPWILPDSTSVTLLCAGFVGLLVALRTFPSLGPANSVMCSVERSSHGEIYFAISVATVFVLSGGERLLYVIPLLVLTFADAGSALIGIRLGRHQYRGADGLKSWEGSAAFVSVAFACVWFPLSLWAYTTPGQNLLVAACVAVLTMLIESSAWRGLDNLFIPVATLAMLRIYSDLHPIALLQRLGMLVGLAGIFLCCRKRALLHEGVLLGALLITYLGWALGDWRWLAAPVAILFVHPLLIRCQHEREAERALLSIGIPPVIWLLGNSLIDQTDWLAPYTVAYASQLTMTGVALQRDAACKLRARMRGCFAAGVIAWALLVLPFFWMRHSSVQEFSILGLSLALLVGTAFVFARFQERFPKPSRPEMYWLGRSLMAFGGSLAFARG